MALIMSKRASDQTQLILILWSFRYPWACQGSMKYCVVLRSETQALKAAGLTSPYFSFSDTSCAAACGLYHAASVRVLCGQLFASLINLYCLNSPIQFDSVHPGHLFSVHMCHCATVYCPYAKKS